MNLPEILIRFYFMTLLGAVLIACNGGNSNQQKIQAAQIQGSWEVIEASRNGQATESLDGLFFRFSDNGTLTTNLMGSDVESPYELSGNTIVQKGDDALSYTIGEVADNRLVLETKLQDMDFKLVLQKVTD